MLLLLLLTVEYRRKHKNMVYKTKRNEFGWRQEVCFGVCWVEEKLLLVLRDDVWPWMLVLKETLSLVHVRLP